MQQPDDDPHGGDGHTVGDIQGVDLGTPDAAFMLRAERDARRGGRVYTIRYQAADAAGNSVIESLEVTVPRDIGGAPGTTVIP